MNAASQSSITTHTRTQSMPPSNQTIIDIIEAALAAKPVLKVKIVNRKLLSIFSSLIPPARCFCLFID